MSEVAALISMFLSPSPSLPLKIYKNIFKKGKRNNVHLSFTCHCKRKIYLCFILFLFCILIEDFVFYRLRLLFSSSAAFAKFEIMLSLSAHYPSVLLPFSIKNHLGNIRWVKGQQNSTFNYCFTFVILFERSFTVVSKW